MEESYKLEKEYKIPFETFREGYIAFQKKYVYPRSYIYILIFGVLAGIFVAAVIEDKSQYIAYMLIVVCLAAMFIQWYNPRRARSELFSTVKAMGEPVYRIGIAKDHIDISTVDHEDVENEGSEEELPESTRIMIDENYSLLEYDGFFLLFSGKEIFYIVPKTELSSQELEIIRDTAKNH